MYKVVEIGNSPNDTKLNLNTYQPKVLYIHLLLTPEVQFPSVSLQETETEFEHLTVNGTLYTLNTYPETLILVRFSLRLAVSDTTCTMLVKLGNAANDPKLNLNTYQ